MFDIFRKMKEKKKQQKRMEEINIERTKQRMISQITRVNTSLGKFEVSLDKKLRVGVNKAIQAKHSGDNAGLKNAYIDIKMAMRFKALASGMGSVMSRLQSNVEFANLAGNMASTIQDAAKLTAQTPQIDIARLDSLYQSILAPMEDICDRMEQFNDLQMNTPFDDFAVSDEDVERLINQTIASPGVPIAVPYDPSMLNPAGTSANAPFQTSKDDSIEAMIRELNDISKKFKS